ncbi:S8 family serine peptidase [Kitasatospora sp. NPDC058201]|uniref:S8 family serine peptidase n=1 Tax=unclassified Kitasatospora TaxID=2633591 RepID=UPI0036468AFF
MSGRATRAGRATVAVCGLTLLAAVAPSVAAGPAAVAAVPAVLPAAPGAGPTAAVPAAPAVPVTPGVPVAPGAASAPAAPGASPGAAELPGVAQTLPDVKQNGCRKPSARTLDRPGWAQAYLRSDAVWPLSRGAGVTVAVIGSGVDASAGSASGALAGRLKLGPRQYGSGDSGQDCVGHGTFLAGLVAGRRMPDGGPSGLAPGATVLAVAATDDAGSTTSDLLAKGIRAAVDGGARIAVVAAPVAEPAPALAEAVGYAAAKGVLLVAPAGPDGQTAAAPVYPAGYPGVLAVTGLAPDGSVPVGAAGGGASGGGAAASGAAGAPAGRASRVDLAAPGEAVQAAGPGGGHFTASGPSYAAALVAGAAALVLGRSPELTVEQLADRLRETAYRPGSAVPDPVVGWGVVDPVTAVTVAPAAAHAPLSPTDPVVVPPPADRSAVRRASALAGAILGGAALVGLAAAAVRAGRRRGWRAG